MSRARLGALLVLAAAGAAAVMALGFRVHFPTDPLGPRAFPLVGAGLVALGGISLWRQPPESDVWPSGPDRLRLAGAVAVFLAFALLLAPLGFVAATTGAFTALAVLFGGRPLPAAALGLAFSVALYVLFVYGLGLTLPLGILLRS